MKTRYSILVLLAFLLVDHSTLPAQQRVLLHINKDGEQEAIPMRKGESTEDVLSSFVTVRVYDLLGREVATLVNEEKPAANHTVQWDAYPFASGVYFYRLQAGNFSDTKKLLFLK
jgi:hypothetical protein